MIKRLIFIASFFLLITGLKAQNGFDVHFTQNHLVPVTLNPALTGAFYGTVRVGGIYRDQWSSFLSNQFTTTNVYADSPILTGLKENDWIGAGINIYSDEAGTVGLNHTALKLSLAYHLSMDEDGYNLLSFGLQGGFGQRKLKDLQNPMLLFEEEILDPSMSAMERNQLMMDGQSFFDIGAGVAFSSVFSDNADFNLGLSVTHFTGPRISLIRGDEKLKMRIGAHAKLNMDLSDRLVLSPSIYFQSQVGVSELQAQVMVGYRIKPEQDITLNLGAGYRFGDAYELMVGLDYGDLRVGLAYDITSSILDPSSSFELGVGYIFKIYTKPDVKPAVICPRL